MRKVERKIIKLLKKIDKKMPVQAMATLMQSGDCDVISGESNNCPVEEFEKEKEQTK